MHIKNKVCLVTGGASGIGKAVCALLLEKGGHVLIADINYTVGSHVKQEFEEKYGKSRVCFIHCDVTSKSDLQQAFLLAKDTFGHLEIVVNNAGIVDENSVDRTLDINVKGVIFGTQLALEHMGRVKNGDGGVVVNTASVAGLRPQPYMPLYSASKFAVVAYTKSVGDSIYYSKYGVRVNAVCPAVAQTNIVDGESFKKFEFGDILQEFFESSTMMTAEFVAQGFIQLIEDDSRNGAVLRITAHKGYEYMDYSKRPGLQLNSQL